MPFVLNSNAVITCPHGGVVTLVPKQEIVIIQGGAVMRLGDIEGSVIVGCTQYGLGIKPCTTVLATLPGSIAPTVFAVKLPVHLQTYTALTDGVPTGIVSVKFPGQVLVQAPL